MRRFLLLAGLALLPWLTGCGTVGYYAQAVRGQAGILHRQQPVERLLANSNTPPALRRQLELVLRLRAFAETELGLPTGGHYRHYADLGRPYAVWNVHATPEFSLEARSWWYPVVGRLEYRGYFSEAKARRLAGKLSAQGYDVHVGGVAAYSTLGWFRDPVLNTFVFAPEADLADTLFHELTHQRLFVPGDTDFNEALATAVAEAGVERWLTQAGDPAALRRHREAVARRDQFVALVLAARGRLAHLYGMAAGPVACRCPSEGGGNCAEDCVAGDLRRRKAALFADLRRDYEALKEREWGGAAEYDGWFRRPLNNALLHTVDTYHTLVPAFRRRLADRAGDWEGFFREMAELGRLSRKERHRRLTEAR
ncbi:MAG: hypothetical protein RJA22_557 [Verrucomicrobiota bacterium]